MLQLKSFNISLFNKYIILVVIAISRHYSVMENKNASYENKTTVHLYHLRLDIYKNWTGDLL